MNLPGPIIPPCKSRRAELEIAKEILAEIFGVRAVEVEEMIQMRLKERSWETEQTNEEGLWPATFCLGEELWTRASRWVQKRFSRDR